MNWIIIKLIRLYQLFISPILGQRCRFHPTCSCYAMESYKRFNFLTASYMAFIRIIKCHPFHPGGHDPVPKAKNNSLKKYLDKELSCFKS